MFPLHLLINMKKTLSGYQLLTTRARVSAQHILERQSRTLAFEIKGKAISNNFLGLTKIFVATGIITNSFNKVESVSAVLGGRQCTEEMKQYS